MAPSPVPVLEIGGTHVTAALVDVDAWAVIHGIGARSDLDPSGSADQIITAIIDTAATLGPERGDRWGVAIPGPFDYARGIADFRGVGKLDGLRDVDLGVVLRDRLNGGTGRVSFVNDAEAFAIGEWIAGDGRGHDRMVGVTLGTGVGSAFLVGGVAQRRGPGVPPEGRLDLVHIDGRPLEDTISRRGIRARYARLAASPTATVPDVREIAARATGGEPEAILVLDEAMSALGRVLAPFARDFEASLVVVGGSIALAWPLIEAPLGVGMSLTCPGWSERTQLVRARLIDEAALVGAAHHLI